MGKICFYSDEHIPHAVTAGLRARGYDAISAADAGMLGAADDDHLVRAAAEGRVLVSNDRDFTVLQWKYPHAGIALTKNVSSIGSINTGLELIAEVYDSSEMEIHLEFL